MNTIEYLAAVKARHGIQSDYELSKLLGVTRQAVSRYQSGKSHLSTALAIKVAELLEKPEGEVMAAIEAERAPSPEIRSAWESVARQMAAIAASVLLSVITLFPSQSEAKPTSLSASDSSMYIMLNNELIETI